MINDFVFLCGARDFHAFDWYLSCKSLSKEVPFRVSIITDLIAGEGYKKLVGQEDDVKTLIILDRFLFKKESGWGNIWRNILKALFFPIQVILLIRHDRRHPGAFYFAHSMYYLWLASFAGLNYVGTPQGSEVLLKLDKSFFYRWVSLRAFRKAKFLTVDSEAMRLKIHSMSDQVVYIVQNGINVESIKELNSTDSSEREGIVSIRGLSQIYQIESILKARNSTPELSDLPISLVYPFSHEEYAIKVRRLLVNGDKDLGRLHKNELYELLAKSILVVSIPMSDSSPRSVYESIFSGCAVAVLDNLYLASLPLCMLKRVIIINLNDSNWLFDAYRQAKLIVSEPYKPSIKALVQFDQVESMKKVLKLVNEIKHG